MREKPGLLRNISESGFMRSVLTRVLVIFITVSVIIAGAAFLSFTTEIRRSILDDRQMQLSTVEKTISGRLSEVSSIAYNIGNDSAFYLEPVGNDADTAREMTRVLDLYLVGNSYISNLAFARVAEPDILYTSKGTRSLTEFLRYGLGVSEETTDFILENTHKLKEIRVAVLGGNNGCFIYEYPLPQLSPNPQAHVLATIPVKEFMPLFETLSGDSNGEVVIFEANGGEIYRTGDLEDEIDFTEFIGNSDTEEIYKAASGQKYVLQKVVSKSNSWTYVSVMRYSDTLSGLANKQLAFIIFTLFLLMGAIVIMLYSIIAEYKPISNLAAQMADKEKDGTGKGFIDERTLIPETIATLRDDSEQKQKYETAYYEAEAASKAKSTFLSNMSHDIRTPMNAIIGMTALARKHIDNRDYVDECLQKVETSSDYLLDIINNVLDMSRIESGRIPIAEEPVMIPALIDSVVSLMTSSIDAKAQKLTVDISELKQTAVIGDNIHMVQVFVNILSNAVKFTPEGGKLTVKVQQMASEEEGIGCYAFYFSDTGIGIAPEFISRVFETFSRSDDAAASQIEGTGLGMAIARKLVEMMGGTIDCESELGKGTTFTVIMKMKYADENTIASTNKESGFLGREKSDKEDKTLDLSGKRILLVEDNIMNQEIAYRILTDTGAEVIKACNGAEAVELFSHSSAGDIDLIFMDIQMPVMNGYEATRVIRSMNREDADKVLIYAMTANTFDEDVRLVKDAGMNGHIGKPYSPQTLQKILVNAFNLH